MTEKEKMLKEELYIADEELVQERAQVKDLCYTFNHLLPSYKEEKDEVFKEIVGKVGKNFWVEQPFMCDYGYNIEIGDNFYSNHNLLILDPGKVTIGDNVFIGPNVSFYTAGHPLDKEKRRQQLEYAKKITIGNDVWIGGSVCILPGVTIGNNVVIGAGSVVNKDIPDNVVAAGNPCKIIKSSEEIE